MEKQYATFLLETETTSNAQRFSPEKFTHGAAASGTYRRREINIHRVINIWRSKKTL
jgi:hypothetical protein